MAPSWGLADIRDQTPSELDLVRFNVPILLFPSQFAFIGQYKFFSEDFTIKLFFVFLSSHFSQLILRKIRIVSWVRKWRRIFCSYNLLSQLNLDHLLYSQIKENSIKSIFFSLTNYSTKSYQDFYLWVTRNWGYNNNIQRNTKTRKHGSDKFIWLYIFQGSVLKNYNFFRGSQNILGRVN